MVKYSLIVPAHNEEKTIVSCLKFLRKQTFSDFEIIVVNNNCTDDSIKLAEKYADKIVNEKRQGYIHAVNRGVKHSDGGYFAVCDADSIYPEKWLKRIDKIFSDNQTCVGTHGIFRFYDSNPVINFLSEYFLIIYLMWSRLFGMHNPCGANFAIKKEDYYEVRGYNTNYVYAGPDIVLGKKLKERGELIFDIKNIIYTSARRYKRSGFIKTSIMYLRYWYQIARGKTPDLRIEEYERY
ncbi:MAG: glycosyltransferase family 2 protein [Nanoarchaeota archaeon]|nr:glycosyltransferase family 2 protein [Nanoarchaeota archaeon]